MASGVPTLTFTNWNGCSDSDAHSTREIKGWIPVEILSVSHALSRHWKLLKTQESIFWSSLTARTSGVSMFNIQSCTWRYTTWETLNSYGLETRSAPPHPSQLKGSHLSKIFNSVHPTLIQALQVSIELSWLCALPRSGFETIFLSHRQLACCDCVREFSLYLLTKFSDHCKSSEHIPELIGTEWT